MGSLAGKSPANTYKSLLKVADETNGVSGTKSTIEDGEGTASALSLSNQVVHIQGSTNASGTMKVMKSNGDLLFGTGTDPNTTQDKAAVTDETVHMLFNVPFNMTIDACKAMVSTDQDTDCTINVHLMSYDMTADGTTNDGNLSNGTVLADGQATSVDRNVLKSIDMTIQSSSVTSGKVIACFVENETNTDDINIQVQVKYHIA
jgi:hypothetical protein